MLLARFALSRRLTDLLLDTARQLVPPLRRNNRVLTRHLQRAVPSHFRSLNRTRPFLLKPANVRSPKSVRAKAREVTPFSLRRLVQGIADT